MMYVGLIVCDLHGFTDCCLGQGRVKGNELEMDDFPCDAHNAGLSDLSFRGKALEIQFEVPVEV